MFLAGRRTGLRRARALLDFERQDDDELGFRCAKRQKIASL